MNTTKMDIIIIVLAICIGVLIGWQIHKEVSTNDEQPAWRSEIAKPAPDWTAKYGDSDGAVLAYFMLKMDFGQAKRFADPNLVRVGNKVKIGWDGRILKEKK